ncbi:MAG: sigma factor [Limisphaerales bacterium]
MTPDNELLRHYAKTNSQDAFAELVKRHVNLVYSAALRQINGDEHLAKDIAQSVFTDLARKAASLSRRESLTGWLYTSTHFSAAKMIRTEQRRHAREQEAHTMRELLQDPAIEADWKNFARRSMTPCTNSRKPTAKLFCCVILKTGNSPKSARNSA